MQLLNKLSKSYPLALAIGLVVISILLSQVGAMLAGSVFNNIDSGTVAVYTRYGCTGLMIILIWKLDGLEKSGISNPIDNWHKHWLLATMPLLVIVGLNLYRVQWHELAWNMTVLPEYFFTHLATGLFEEVMMRALVFFILARAWSKHTNGLLKAAIAQACIFGALHLLNLLNGVSITVLIQAVYATLIGVSFAGIVAFSRTIWPVVICHTVINASGSINRTFVANYNEEAIPVSLYLVFTLVIFVATTIPAIYLLCRTAKSMTEPQESRN